MNTINAAIDISGLARRQQEYEQKWHSLVENIPDIIITVDRTGIISAINRTVKGLTRNEVIGQSIYGYIDKRYHDTVRRKQSSCFKTGKTNEYTILGTGDSGPCKAWYRTRIVPVERGGDIVSIMLISTDITAQRKAEDKLKRSLELSQRIMEGTIQAMAKAVEMRDPYTAGHQRRVAKLASIIASQMRLPKSQIEGVRVAGTLHDVGKIYVPAEILSKPERLNEIEFNLVKEHPRVGYEILKNGEFPWPIAGIILQHHERLDGSGYPQGISEKKIRLEARILAVADIVEAMASHRPYRPALGINKALEEIEKNKGKLYDVAAVDICVRLFNRKKSHLPLSI